MPVITRTTNRTIRVPRRGRRVKVSKIRTKIVRKVKQPRRSRPINRQRKIKRTSTRNFRMNQLAPSVRQYMHCRLDPFSTSGSLGIPDLSNRPRVTVDHRMIINFTAGSSGGFRIAVMPWLPHPILVKPLADTDTTFTVDGSTQTINNSARTAGYWYCPSTLIEWANSQVTRNAENFLVDKVNAPYNAKSFRFVTIGAKVSYTGSAMTNQGTILVNDGAFDVRQPELNNALVNVFDGTQTVKTWDANQVFTSCVNFEPNFNNRSNSAYNGTAKAGAYMLLINQSADHLWQPIFEQMNFPWLDPIAANCLMAVPNTDALTATTAAGMPCVQAFDPHWAPKLINISGLSAASSFQLELVYCVEYGIDSSSEVSAFASKPKPYPQQVQRVDAAIQQVPPNRSLFSSFVDGVSNVLTNVADGFMDRTLGPPRPPQRSRTFYNRASMPMIEEAQEE